MQEKANQGCSQQPASKYDVLNAETPVSSNISAEMETECFSEDLPCIIASNIELLLENNAIEEITNLYLPISFAEVNFERIKVDILSKAESTFQLNKACIPSLIIDENKMRKISSSWIDSVKDQTEIF